jgi:hypothetical protein
LKSNAQHHTLGILEINSKFEELDIIMKLKILTINFTRSHNWLYKLVDENATEYYIMTFQFYEIHKLKSPINKHHLDYFEKGISINASTKVDNLNVVLDIH